MLVSGVGQLYQGDLDLGRRALERLEVRELGSDVAVEDLSYGAVAAAQRLEELRPEVLVVVGAEVRGRAPGTVERRVVRGEERPPELVQRAVADAVTGYIGIELLVEVARGLGVLPERTVLIEVEPAAVLPSERLSPQAESGLKEALALVRAEVNRDRAGR